MGPDGRRVLLTAPFGGEGTTTTVLNLSRAFAELGEDVLLVEGDTRRPVIAGLLNVESGEGLVHALADPSIATEAVKPTAISNLFVLAARSARRDGGVPCSAFPPEVLDNVLADLSSRFSRTVIDGPPVLATADAALLAGAVHGTVLVVRAGRTTTDELVDALTALRAVGAQIVGTVLTDARLSMQSKAAARAYRAKVRGLLDPYLQNRDRLVANAALLTAFVFACFLFGVLSVRLTTEGAMLIAATFCVVVYWVKPEGMVAVALIGAFAALPQGLHVGKVIGPAVIYAYLVAALLAICYLLPLARVRFSDYLLPGLFTLVVAFATVVGFQAGSSALVVWRESITLLEMVVGFVLRTGHRLRRLPRFRDPRDDRHSVVLRGDGNRQFIARNSTGRTSGKLGGNNRRRAGPAHHSSHPVTCHGRAQCASRCRDPRFLPSRTVFRPGSTRADHFAAVLFPQYVDLDGGGGRYRLAFQLELVRVAPNGPHRCGQRSGPRGHGARDVVLLRVLPPALGSAIS